MKLSIVTFAGLGLMAAVACDKSASDAQDMANNAQAKANTEITNAQINAGDKMKSAQAEADKKVAQAQADFDGTREDYRHTVQSNLDAIDKKLADLDAKAKTAQGAANADLTAKAATLRAQRNAFANDFATLDHVAVASWDDTKARLDKEWTDLRNAVDKVL